MKEEIKMFVKENTWLPGIDCGWGNGYIIIPKGHKLHSIHYDNIDVTVHGGLTFGKSANDLKWKELISKDSNNGWVIGFDTSHCDDTILNWSKEAVIAETKRLKIQIENYK